AGSPARGRARPRIAARGTIGSLPPAAGSSSARSIPTGESRSPSRAFSNPPSTGPPMSLRELWIRLTIPFLRGRMERELREELSLHLELRAEQLGQEGLRPYDASLAARRRFGNVSRIADASRAAWGWHWLYGSAQDLRYVARQLIRRPGFALVVSLTIALGGALNTVAFTFYDAVALKPLPVGNPGELIRVMRDLRVSTPELLPYSAYDVLRQSARSVGSVIATTSPVPIRIRL